MPDASLQPWMLALGEGVARKYALPAGAALDIAECAEECWDVYCQTLPVAEPCPRCSLLPECREVVEWFMRLAAEARGQGRMDDRLHAAELLDRIDLALEESQT